MLSKQPNSQSQELLPSVNMLARPTIARVMRPMNARNISFLVNKPSTVAESQKIFTTGHNPTYKKRSSDKVLVSGLFIGLGLGAVQWLRGEFCMATGSGKKE